jgi:hypothetical protein
MNTEYCVKFYSQISEKSAAKLHETIEPFESEVEARIFALSYLRNFPNKGYIRFWRIDPMEE